MNIERAHMNQKIQEVRIRILSRSPRLPSAEQLIKVESGEV